jgi:hypothetical protein
MPSDVVPGGGGGGGVGLGVEVAGTGKNGGKKQEICIKIPKVRTSRRLFFAALVGVLAMTICGK